MVCGPMAPSTATPPAAVLQAPRCPPYGPAPAVATTIPARLAPRQDAAAHQALHGRPHVVVHGQQGPDVAGGNALGMLAHHRDDLLAQATQGGPGQRAGASSGEHGSGRRLGSAALPRQVREQVQEPQLPSLGLFQGAFQGGDEGVVGRRARGRERRALLGRGARRVRLPWGVRARRARRVGRRRPRHGNPAVRKASRVTRSPWPGCALGAPWRRPARMA